MHSFSKKGGAGTLGYNDMTAVTQILEVLLEKLRKKEMVLTGEMASALQDASAVIATQSAIHRDGGKVDANAVSAVCVRLEQFLLSPNPSEQDNNSGAPATGRGTNEESDDPNYGFFGGTPQISEQAGEPEDDYGFFRESPPSKTRNSK